MIDRLINKGMEEINKFFNNKNNVQSDAAIDQSQVGDYLQAVKAFSRLTYQSLYVIDYQTRAFEYVSENPLFLCGKSSEEVKELGYAFYFQNVKTEDVELLIRINEAGFEFYENIPVEERKLYSISYDFYLINNKKNMVLVNHKLTPMFLTEEGQIWKALCIVSLSNSTSSGNVVVSREGSDELWKYDPVAKRWGKDEKIKLSQREYEILRLYASGLTINEIAEKLFISADTVKFHRKKLFDKIGVNNIAEALSYAKTNKLL
ncbi:regulatory protein, luxR family [Chryseobacterium carnipullorum]|nr:regulatory protein, luxR family [Chryseobacterium carnipullorum]